MADTVPASVIEVGRAARSSRARALSLYRALYRAAREFPTVRSTTPIATSSSSRAQTRASSPRRPPTHRRRIQTPRHPGEPNGLRARQGQARVRDTQAGGGPGEGHLPFAPRRDAAGPGPRAGAALSGGLLRPGSPREVLNELDIDRRDDERRGDEGAARLGFRRHAGQHAGPGHRQGAVRARDRPPVAAQGLVGQGGIPRAASDVGAGPAMPISLGSRTDPTFGGS